MAMQPATGRPGTTKKAAPLHGGRRLLTAFCVLWVLVYLVGGAIALAAGHSATGQVGLAVGAFFGVLFLVAWRRHRRLSR